MAEPLYKVEFKLTPPMSDDDIRAFIKGTRGGEITDEAFAYYKDDFFSKGRFDTFIVTTTPLPIDEAMVMKMRFGGTLKKI